jgi:hypothetical protein
MLVWAHAVLFGAIALLCYFWPQTAFGESAWLPLPRLSALLFAAALSALVILLVGSARSGSYRALRLALIAALALDIQIPVLIFSQPAWFDFQQGDLGLPPFLVWFVFIVLVGVTVFGLASLKRAYDSKTSA